ncbi:hypothetical protein STRIP9103_02943 [Streptomyces ipomoeae 91-03]|uniref:Uncharacterized protein n=1 Tax=Streptomyces ipomoeae 91-03 TaxID=698759 RepID=L1L4Z2_9ACTN|nr:hypothetical protein STRIP9103_02943 [Streptomyces ipomoeae 91-03]
MPVLPDRITSVSHEERCPPHAPEGGVRGFRRGGVGCEGARPCAADLPIRPGNGRIREGRARRTTVTRAVGCRAGRCRSSRPGGGRTRGRNLTRAPAGPPPGPTRASPGILRNLRNPSDRWATHLSRRVGSRSCLTYR